MATRIECPFYDQCGYVAWRKARPDIQILPLPEDGDCGKNIKMCGRVKPDVPFKIEFVGPQTREELEIAFPELPNKNNRPKRRLTGGGHR